MSPPNSIREWLRRRRSWIVLQETRDEGWVDAYRRRRIQPLILNTAPIRTAAVGPIEVRILTWRRDWINLIWALKSFYEASGVDYPLFIHDVGLDPGQANRLLDHFPDASIVGHEEADARLSRSEGGRSDG